jgi:hypothetical protein
LDEQTASRFKVVVEQGVPHGDLYELEQATHYHVIDRHSDRVVVTFEGQLEASLSRDTGLWDDYRLSGVCEVGIAPDERSVTVKYHDGREESVALPE